MSEDFNIRFEGGGPWDMREIEKEYTPKAFDFFETVDEKLINRKYVFKKIIHLYELEK